MEKVKLNNEIVVPMPGFRVFRVTDLAECKRSILGELNHMIKIIIGVLLLVTTSVLCSAQTPGGYPSTPSRAEQEILDLSKKKWDWMAAKNADSLAILFDDKSVFVHMGGGWGKMQEVNVIKSGGIHYKKADIHSASVNIIGNTAILLNNITLLAVVGGNEVTNPFIVTEVYIRESNRWKLGSLSFTKINTPGSPR